jgi:2-polyprenyl-3-methyl-5-hydroxy-6-metoxy-1,4-benzoquinol methylase
MSGTPPRPSITVEMLNAVAHEVRSLREASDQPSPSHSAFGKSPSPDSGGDHSLAYDIEQFLRTVSNPAQAVGRMPPEPPTLRGRAGGVLVRLVKRCLFWYTDQINEMLGVVGDLFRRVSLRLSQLEQESAAGRQDLTVIRDSLPGDFKALLRLSLKEERAKTNAALEVKLADVHEVLRDALDNERVVITQTFEAALSGAIQTDLESKLTPLRESLRKAELLLHQTRSLLHAQESRIALLLRKGSQGGRGSLAAVPQSVPGIAGDELGPLYLAFENLFRGGRNDIKERVSEYLPLVTGRQIGTSQMPVLDLGCGRGEWLELLAENGLTASGVDSNQSCVSECHARGLSVREADALSFLAELPEQSQGAVTAFHVVEHMPFRTILNLLDEAVRVLKPGGLLILETPNPANLIVGAHTFYLDPTHLRPLPADLLRFFVESRGFCGVEVRPLHPFPDCFRVEGEPNSAAAVLNDLVYGARDYAIVAERP